MKFSIPASTKYALTMAITLPVFLFTIMERSFGYTVSNLTATYSNGQVFLVWKNPGAMDLQYNVYRSAVKFSSSSQLTADKFIGFVRDESSKNIHMSMQQGTNVYYKINDGSQPLGANQGVYVVTCGSNQSWYYAVTVTDLATGKEAKNLTPGSNTLSSSINEIVAKPQPVFQDSLEVASGEVKHRYVQFGDNLETPLFPALNSTGSYGFNFYIVKRGNAALFPLVVIYEGEGATDAGGVGLDEEFTNCYVLGVDDWLPIPNNSDEVGDNTHYCCYHEDFNIYSKTNPVPTTGIVKTYPQRRYIEAIRWMKDHFPIDDSRVYLKGSSASGYGALLTASIIPEEIAAVYATVEPVSIGTNGQSLLEQMWGLGSYKLNTDIQDPNTLLPIPFTKLSDLRKMITINQNLELPLIFDVHGKKDKSVNWSQGKIDWYDSLKASRAGGVFYWDQREHNGANKNFLSEETTPDFFRYSSSKSYPAFTNCSIDQNPGNGSANNGDPYGAINGYLDWEDDITDNECDYSIDVFVKDLYVGGVLDPEQFSTCTVDITFRRLQHFNPASGATIKWKNFNASNTKIQGGTISNYNGGFITLKDIIVNKSGNRLELKISNCLREDPAENSMERVISFVPSGIGYYALIEMEYPEMLSIQVVDLLGKVVFYQNEFLSAGTNSISLPQVGSGIYIVRLQAYSFTHTEKLRF